MRCPVPVFLHHTRDPSPLNEYSSDFPPIRIGKSSPVPPDSPVHRDQPQLTTGKHTGDSSPLDEYSSDFPPIRIRESSPEPPVSPIDNQPRPTTWKGSEQRSLYRKPEQRFQNARGSRLLRRKNGPNTIETSTSEIKPKVRHWRHLCEALLMR